MTTERFTGLRDAHLHIAEHGEELSCVNLADATSADECLQRLARAARERDPASTSWIKAVAARNNAWRDPTWPTAAQIDEATGGRPAFIMSFDHHAVVASTRVLEAVRIDRHTPDPEGGVIEKRGGEPTGLLLESAAWIVRTAAPAPSPAEYEGHVRAALADLEARGFVEVHDMLARPALARVLLDLESRGELRLHVRLYAMHEPFRELVRVAESWESERVRMGGLKIFTDGTLNSRTAWMLEPWAEAPAGLERGKPMMTPAQIEDAVREADEAGYPIAAHAIGDGAVRAVLDAIERVGPSTMGQRVEHAQFVSERDIERFAALGVIASVQPCHLLTDVEAIARFAPDRAGRTYPLRDLIDAASAAGFDGPDLVWLGSDAPIVPPSPADNMQAAVQRRRVGVPASAAVGAEQAITHDEMLECSRSRL